MWVHYPTPPAHQDLLSHAQLVEGGDGTAVEGGGDAIK
jgi:hypothetical protein